MPFSLQACKHTGAVAAVSECCIKSVLSWLDLEKIEDFLYENRDMHAGRCASLLDHMLNGPLIFLRIQFFVFLIVIPRMCAFVADAAFVFFLFFHKMFSLYFKYI